MIRIKRVRLSFIIRIVCIVGAEDKYRLFLLITEQIHQKEGRMLIKQLLKATQAGLGKGETPIFPIQIFKMKKV